MALPEKLRIDFTPYERDLVTEGLNKMLAVFYDACTLRQFVAVLLKQAQELYDAALKVQQGRTLYEAQGVNLDGIGRIVGQDRALWSYSEDGYMHFDIEGQGFDQEPWWCLHGPLEEYIKADDNVYATAILSRIVKNHTLVASVPEITQLIQLLLNTDVSFVKTGPNTVQLVLPYGIDKSAIAFLTQYANDTRVDETYRAPYPVTLSFDDAIIFIPLNPFHFDRDEPFQWDQAEWAVGVPFNRP